MNTNKLKATRPTGADKAFIEAVSAQAARLGITAKGIAPSRGQGRRHLLVGTCWAGLSR